MSLNTHKRQVSNPEKKRLRDILGNFGLLAYYTQLDVSFQIHYVA